MKTLVITIGLLCSACWLVGQTSSKKSLDPRSQQDTVQGCLMGSDGNFTLTDSMGIKYKLSGNTSQLSSRTKHQVEVLGKVEHSNNDETTNSPTSTDTSTGTQGTGTATKQGVVQTFHVSKVTKVAGACSEKK